MRYAIAIAAVLSASPVAAQFMVDAPRADLRAKLSIIVLGDLKIGDEARLAFPSPCIRNGSLFLKVDTQIIGGELVGPTALLRMDPGKTISMNVAPRPEVNRSALDTVLLMVATAQPCGQDIDQSELIPVSTINGKRSARELLAD